MKRRTLWYLLIPVVLFGAIYVTLNIWEPEYAYLPPQEKILNPSRVKGLQTVDEKQYDLWGQTLTIKEAANSKTDPSKLSPANGAVEINEALLKLGRETLYRETFGNEVFLTDIMGIVDGPLTITNIAKAIVQLKGQGTTNLQVELAKDVTLGDRTYRKGEKIDTGIDVPKGAYAPLGMPVKYSEGRLKVGISCMACHATVDPQSKRTIEGAPNVDLNAGLLMALATNSSAYFTHTDIENVRKYMDSLKDTIQTSDGRTRPLPDPVALEKAVDETFVKWPRGNFDSTIDMKSNPAQIPDSFTKGGHPYGWSGFAMAGPFHGLSAFSNNVHAQNSDPLAQVEASPYLFGMDKEVYIGTILQNAANPKYRYNPKSGQKPSEFFAKVDPTPGVPGVNEMIKPPSFPKLTMMAPDGVYISSPGYRAGEQVNAMAAYQNAIIPPVKKESAEANVIKAGETVFQRAQCIACHAGDAFTNHRIISSQIIGTEPSRAKALKKTEYFFGKASFYTPDTPVPVPPDAKTLNVPTGQFDPEQVKLAYAHGDSRLRRQVIAANQSVKTLQDVHVAGTGHEYWVDETTGFTKEQQDAIIRYLLSLKGK